MNNGCLERARLAEDGSFSVSGWTFASLIEIALVSPHDETDVLLEFAVRPEVRRPDVPGAPVAGFSATIGTGIRRLLPPATPIRIRADGATLENLTGTASTVPGTAASADKLRESVAAGLRWNPKTAELFEPIDRWTPQRRLLTLDLLSDASALPGCQLFPARGTLLGIVRGGSLLPHDNDVDVSAFVTGTTVDEVAANWAGVLRNVAEVLCATVTFSDGMFRTELHRNGVSLDCSPTWVRDDGSFIDDFARGEYTDLQLIETVIDQHRVSIPLRATELLAQRYGQDFLVPDLLWRPNRLEPPDARGSAALDFRSRFRGAMLPHVTLTLPRVTP